MPRTQPRRRTFRAAGLDVVEHDLRVNIVQVDKRNRKGKTLETLNFRGRMVIERQNPVRNDQNQRQIEFKVKTWAATAFSQVLQQDILYILSEDADQPMSTITAEQEDSDFPAAFEFNVIFDARVGNATVIRQHHGKPAGHGFMVVPPDGNRRNSPTITDFETAFIQVEHPKLGRIGFVPVDCNDRSSETVLTFA
jgi:hypothetical protein